MLHYCGTSVKSKSSPWCLSNSARHTELLVPSIRPLKHATGLRPGPEVLFEQPSQWRWQAASVRWCACHREKLSHSSLCQLDSNMSLINWFTAVIMPGCCWHKMLSSLNVTGRLVWLFFQEVNGNGEIPAPKKQNEREQKKNNLLLMLFVAGIKWLHNSSSTLEKGNNKNKPVLWTDEILELFAVQVHSAKVFLEWVGEISGKEVTSCQTTWRNMSRQVKCN